MGLDRVLCFRTLRRNRQKKEVARAKRKAEVEEGGEKERRGGPSETKCSQERGRPLSGDTPRRRHPEQTPELEAGF